MIKPDSPFYPLFNYVHTLEEDVEAKTSAAQILQSSLELSTQQLEDVRTALSASQALVAALDESASSLRAEMEEKIARHSRASRVIGVILMMDYMNVPYKFDKEYPEDKAVDCSSLMQFAWQVGAGVSLPRNSRKQSELGAEVPFDQMQVGDMIFYDFDHDGVITHVGIYMGNGQMIHANSVATGINIVDVNTWNRGGVAKIRRI
jgi:cell wall-associated NlpC family hydrolase